jgi:hypothetical protein
MEDSGTDTQLRLMRADKDRPPGGLAIWGLLMEDAPWGVSEAEASWNRRREEKCERRHKMR